MKCNPCHPIRSGLTPMPFTLTATAAQWTNHSLCSQATKCERAGHRKANAQSLPARSLVSWSAAPNRLVALVFRPSNTALSAVAQANCTTTDTIRFGLLLDLLGDRVGRPRKWPTHGHACTPQPARRVCPTNRSTTASMPCPLVGQLRKELLDHDPAPHP